MQLEPEIPHAAQKAVAALYTRVVPLQRGFGRCSEHGVQPGRVSTVFFNQVLRVNAIVFTLAHGAHAFVVHYQAVGFAFGRQHLARAVMNVFDLARPEILDAALVTLARVDMVEHHALGEQFGEGLIDLDEVKVTHDLGPKAGVQQMQNSVLDTANVLIHRHPVVGAFGHHGLVVFWIAIAHVIPRAVDKSIHRVGLASAGLAAHRAHHTRVKPFVLVQRVTRTIRHTIQRQDYRQILFGNRHRAVLRAMNHGNRRAPIALAADAPVAQTPGGFFLAQAFGHQVSGHGVNGGFKSQSVVLAGVHRHALLLVAVPVSPQRCIVSLALDVGDLPDRQTVLVRKLKIPLIMGRHAHDRAIAVAHEHIVANPDLHLLARERVRDKQACAFAFFLLGGQLGFRGAAGLAFFNKCSQFWIRQGGMYSQRMLGRHRAKRYAHDGVGTRGEDVHAAVADQRTGSISNVMGERKANTFAFANPVFLHQLDALWPARQAVRNVAKQLFSVGGNLQVITRDLALFNHCPGAPALAINHLLVGQHGHIDRVPVDDLGLAVGNAFL